VVWADENSVDNRHEINVKTFENLIKGNIKLEILFSDILKSFNNEITKDVQEIKILSKNVEELTESKTEALNTIEHLEKTSQKEKIEALETIHNIQESNELECKEKLKRVENQINSRVS
jgi:hypothetical protein